jgi:EmrB/QacA subfamily drug resistance transporter
MPTIRPYVIAALTAAALFLDFVDTTAVVVALPTMAEDLGEADTAAVSSVAISYLVALAVAMPLSGWLGGRFGPRATFFAAVLVFLIGSLGCGFAPDLGFLVAARSVQGIGGGILVPLALSTVLTAFPEERRQRASAIVAVPAAVAPALGPILGGLLASSGDWRWIFFINVPVGVVCLFVSLRVLPAGPRIREPFDTTGWALTCGGVTGLVVGLALLETSTSVGVIAIIAGICAATLLVVHERRVASPLIPIWLFALRPFSVGLTVMGFASVAFAALIFILPTARQSLLGESAVLAGFVLSAHAVGILLITALTPALISRFGSRGVLVAGMTVSAGATISIAVDPAAGAAMAAIQLAVAGIGFGLCIVPLQTAPFAGMSNASIGRGTTVLSLVRQIGAAFGPAAAAVGLAVGSVSGDSTTPFVSALLVSAALAALGAVIALFLRTSPDHRIA